MIFAAGKGTRLGAITGQMPKALIRINGRTALQTAVEKCNAYGFDDLIVNVHHFADMMEREIEKLREGGFRITVSDERDKLLETGGGLFKARHFFDDRPFLVYNVDIISDLDLTSLYRYHLQKKGLATLASRHRKGNRFFLVDRNGIVRGWRNNVTGEQILSVHDSDELTEIAFSGIHIIEPEIFRFMTEGTYSMKDLYLRLADEHNIFTYVDDKGFWGDIGTPENLEDIRRSQLPQTPGK